MIRARHEVGPHGVAFLLQKGREGGQGRGGIPRGLQAQRKKTGALGRTPATLLARLVPCGEKHMLRTWSIE